MCLNIHFPAFIVLQGPEGYSQKCGSQAGQRASEAGPYSKGPFPCLRMPSQDDAGNVWQGEEAKGAAAEPRDHIPGRRPGARHLTRRLSGCRRVPREADPLDWDREVMN
jgi:hypothetical protein